MNLNAALFPYAVAVWAFAVGLTIGLGVALYGVHVWARAVRGGWRP